MIIDDTFIRRLIDKLRMYSEFHKGVPFLT